jgi:hypothetical protein
MNNQLQTHVLVRNNATWKITRFSDSMFVAKNSFGKSHTFRCVAEVNNFENFLLSKGFTDRETGRSLNTIKRTPVAA